MANGIKSVSIERQRDTRQDQAINNILNKVEKFSHPFIDFLINAGEGDSSEIAGMWGKLWKMAAAEKGRSKK